MLYYEIHRYNPACEMWEELESRWLDDADVRRLRFMGLKVWSVQIFERAE